MLTVGIDVHFTKSSLCILDAHGKIVRREEVKGPWSEVAGLLARLSEPFQVCYEASLGYGHLYDQLRAIPHAQRIQVAHPGHLRLIYKSRKKNDRADGEKLAKLMYLDQVSCVHIPAQDVRSWRSLIEWRRRLVCRSVMVKNQLRSLLKSCGIPSKSGGNLWRHKTGRRWLREQVFPTDMDTLRRDMLMDELEAHDSRIKRVNKTLANIAQAHPGVGLLTMIPGVGDRTAEAFVAYVDDPHRFSRTRNIGSYIGLIPGQDASGQRNYFGHITREGPASLRQYLTEATWRGVQWDASIKRHYEQVLRGDRARRKIAVVATARWLATVMLAMLKTGEAWRGSPLTPE
jgi:transposase